MNTDQPVLPSQTENSAIAIDPATVPEAQRAAVMDALVTHGHFKRADVEAHFGATSAPVPSGNPAIDNLRKNWTGSQADLDQTLQRQGINPNTPAPSDPVLRPELNAPTDANEYPFSYAGRRDYKPDALAKFDAEARSAFKSAEVPANMASGLLSNMLDSAEHYAGLNEFQATLYRQEQKIVLDRVFNGGAEAARKLADLALAKMPEAVRKQWTDAHLFEDAKVVVSLAHVGTLIKARSEKAKK
jgi:hypothetical protein